MLGPYQLKVVLGHGWRQECHGLIFRRSRDTHTEKGWECLLLVVLLGALTSDIEHGDEQAQQPPLPEDLL